MKDRCQLQTVFSQEPERISPIYIDPMQDVSMIFSGRASSVGHVLPTFKEFIKNVSYTRKKVQGRKREIRQKVIYLILAMDKILIFDELNQMNFQIPCSFQKVIFWLKFQSTKIYATFWLNLQYGKIFDKGNYFYCINLQFSLWEPYCQCCAKIFVRFLRPKNHYFPANIHAFL